MIEERPHTRRPEEAITVSVYVNEFEESEDPLGGDSDADADARAHLSPRYHDPFAAAEGIEREDLSDYARSDGKSPLE